jgi:hypothetical protein
MKRKSVVVGMRNTFDKSFLVFDKYKKKGRHNQEEKKEAKAGGGQTQAYDLQTPLKVC